MHIVQRVPRRVQRRMYLASERGVVNGVGLGEVDGLFNVGKMFTRMFTFTPSSFKFKNIAGAIGSAAMFTASGGLSTLAPKATGAHSSLAKGVGYGVIAGAAATGAYFGGSALLSSTGAAGAAGGATGAAGAAGSAGSGVLAASTGAGTSFFALPSVVSTGSTMMAAGSGVLAPAASGFMATAGSVLSTVGSGILSVGSGLMKALPFLGQVMGGGSGGQQQQQQGGMTQAEYDAMQAQAQQQAAYNAQVQAQQTAMYTPGGMPISYVPETGPPSMTGMNASYGDLRSPYTAIAEDGSTVQVDPTTGQIVPEGMSMPMMIGIGGIVALGGWYLMSGSKSTN